MKKYYLQAGLGAVLLILLAYGCYQWFFCRFYVPPEHLAVITAKAGRESAANRILVERGEKGIWREILPEGRYFLDPVLYEVDILPAINIPIGKVGVVTSKIGRALPEGAIIAPDQESQGVWRNVLGPGLYRLNPMGYKVDIVDAINIPIGYVGVITSQTGAAAAPGAFASIGEKGVLKDILQPGLYYLNPRAYQVNVIEIGMNQVSMTGKQGSVIEVKKQIETTSDALQAISANTLNIQQKARQNYFQRSDMVSQGATPGRGQDVVYNISSFVEFPSRDGFKIMMDMTVEFELMPENVSRIYMLFGDLPQVVEKIILPQILSASRLKGSTYKAQDFIMGDGRETFQKNLRQELVNTMKEKSIIIHNAIIRNVSIPQNILQPIQDSSIAVEQNLTNISLQETAKMQAELNTQQAMIQQKRKQVEQETKRRVAEIAANEKQTVRMTLANADLEVANITLERSALEAKTTKLLGETEVLVENMLKKELALGSRMKADALGALGIMSDLKLIENLNPELVVKIIHAGEGTLWTDLKAGSINLTPKKDDRSLPPRASD
ncbi:MAG: hypothetical protein GX564_11255 [Oligosphaeraceae bacterium]|nr:hypothetical protein [Oligosphaeraceae bacterium]